MQIYLLLTEECNLRCGYCIRGEKAHNIISLEKLNKILNKNYFREDQVLLTGGEPLLHKDFKDIAKVCLDAFKYVAVNTNGMLLNEKNVIVNDRIHYQISMDGKDEQHEKLRGIGTFSKVLDRVKMLDDNSISYNVASVINRNNIDEIDKLIPLLYELKKMKYWKVEPQLPFGCGEIEQCVSIDEWNCLVDLLISKTPFRLKIKKLFDFTSIDKIINEKQLKLTKRKLSNCGSCRHKVYIYPDLTVYPCTCLKDFPLGNLKYSSLSEILCGERAKVFKEYTVDSQSQCSVCKYYDICGGGCIGCSYNIFGKLGMGDARCPLIKI